MINWRKTYSNVHFVPTEPPSVSFSPKANQLTILSSFQHLSFRTFGFKESFARNLSPSFQNF
ncbi:MAG: hypothetical protein ACTS43_01395 [Candidatus Hodgkinia cicadicola]